MTMDDFLELMAVDKKNVDGKLRLILLKGELGDCVVTEDFDSAVLKEVLQSYCQT